MIKFYDVKKINARYADQLKGAAEKVIDSGWYINGSRVEKFESSVKTYLRVDHAIGCGNGLDALKLILRAYKEMGVMREGDQVIVPGNTFIATALAVTHNHLRPVFVDVNYDTFLMDPDEVEKCITPSTRAIILVHLYGSVCYDDRFKKLAEKYNLVLIEDNAQAFGAKYGERMSGSLGDAAAHSFYPTKPLGCLGDGGMVTTNNTTLAFLIRLLTNYGSSRKYYHDFRGYNSRLDEIQAAFLSVKMRYIYEEFQYRQTVAFHYIREITNPKILLPKRDVGSAWHLFVVKVDKRWELKKYLEEHGVGTMIHYPLPIHKQEAYEDFDWVSLPTVERLSNEILSLPISSVITEDEVSRVIKLINEWKE
jgi:dTDP-4-amino-4,6-dideoxygalactose transaminase